MRFPVVVMVVLGALGCRDEQAGPRPKASARPSAPAGQVKMLDAAPGDLTWRSGATWAGGTVTYLGSKIDPPNAQPGQTIVLRHYFVANKPPPQGFQFFMHVIDPNTHQQLGNLDHEIQGGAAPLGTWPVGKVVVDEQQLQMPQYAGTAQIVLGFWNDNGRLIPDDPSTHDGQGRVFGPKLEGAQAPPLPEYTAPRAAKPPVIDGKLDDEIWKTAPAVTLVSSYDGRPTQRKTTMRLAWDDQNLYAAFDCEDPDVWGSLLKKDDAIYNEDVVEVFIDADGDGKTYNELEVSPHNTQFDAQFVARRSDLAEAIKWDSGMKSAVQVRGTIDNDADKDEGWSAELQIPIANLMAVPRIPPQKGDRWRFNGYRLEHLQRHQQVEGQAFSPLFIGDFHALPRFGWLIFN